MREIAEEKHCKELGEYRCQGCDTFGPFKRVGGIAKGHPIMRFISHGEKTSKSLMLIHGMSNTSDLFGPLLPHLKDYYVSENDNRCYGNLPGIEFKRSGTLFTDVRMYRWEWKQRRKRALAAVMFRIHFKCHRPSER